MSRTSSAATTVPINELVNRALTLLERFKTSQSPSDRSTMHEEAKSILNHQIPHHPHYVEFVNRHGVFYESFLDMQQILKQHEAIVLESRFQNIRRNSQGVRARTSSLRNLEIVRSHVDKERATKTHSRSNSEKLLDQWQPVMQNGHSRGPSADILNSDQSAVLDPILPYPASPLDGKPNTSMVMPEPSKYQESKSKRIIPLEISPVVLINKIHVSNVLLIDLRPRKKYEASHIKCPLITNFEPSAIRPNMSDFDLQDSLVISDPQEFDSFSRRNEADLICIYDERSIRIQDSTPLQMLSNVLLSSNLPHCLLSGGFSAWERHYSNEIITDAVKLISEDNQRKSTPPLPVAPPQVPSTHKLAPVLPPKIPSFQHSPPQDKPVALAEKHHLPNGVNIPLSLSSSPLRNMPGYHHQLEKPAHYQVAPKSVPFSGTPAAKVNSTKAVPANLPSVSYPTPRLTPPALDPILPTSPNLGATNPRKVNTKTTSKFLEASHLPTQGPPSDGYMDEPAKITLPSLRVPKILSSSNDTFGYPNSGSKNSSSGNISRNPANLNVTKSANNNINSVLPYTEEQVPPYLISNTGLKNLGNTCYMNCIIQCLAAFPQFVQSFYDMSFMRHINYNSRIGHKGQFSRVFADLIRGILNSTANSNNPVLAPVPLKQVASDLRPYDFAGYDQQDCQEFLTFVLDELHEDLNSNGDKPKQGELNESQEKTREQMGIRAASAIEWERYLEGDTSLIVDMFQGQYLSRLQCMTCQHTSTTYNAFSTLSLPIVSTKLLSQHNTLKACFDEFVKPEILTGDNAWFCPHCQAKRRTVKTLQISRLPPILVIHLKRFKRSSSGVTKLETPVDYPVRGLDLTRYWPQLRHHELGGKEAEILASIPSRGQEPPFIYDLRAVTLHSGTLKGGHYTAIVQKPGRGWLYFDDSNVYPIKEQAVVSKNAYVLFYRRRM